MTRNTFNVVMSLEKRHEHGFGGFGLVCKCFGANLESANLRGADVVFSEEIVDNWVRP